LIRHDRIGKREGDRDRGREATGTANGTDLDLLQV
jgi:hypothetical protein